MPKKISFNLFRLNEDLVDSLASYSPEDFAAAQTDEKDNLIEERKSVSYWADAWRRFRENKVSLAALGLFILILLFAFAGPLIVPYSYESQYRSALSLGMMSYSEDEQIAKQLLKDADGLYSPALGAGSVTSLSRGNYYITKGSTTYAFTLESAFEDGFLVLDTDSDEPLKLYSEGDYTYDAETKTLTLTSYTVIEYTDTAEEDATEVDMTTSVFPHVFGTDTYGRDLLSRCMYGTRVSLIIGIFAAIIVLIIGSIYGSISGLLGGMVDFIMMRIVELIYSIPDVLLIILLSVVLSDPLQTLFDTSSLPFIKALSDLGVGIVCIFITFSLLYWVSMARIVRGQVLTLKQQEYVTAARALGVKNSKIITKHLLPNCVGQMVIGTCLQVPSAIFTESFLSYLGMGVSAPMASLGSLCSDAITTISVYPHRMLCPAVILTLLVLSLNLVGDGLRDALDPRLKK